MKQERIRQNKGSSFFAKRFLEKIPFPEDLVSKLREISERGKVVYVVERSSFLDYIILQHLLKKNNLTIPVWANNLAPFFVLPIIKLIRYIKSLFGRPERRDRTSNKVRSIIAGEYSFVYFIKRSDSIFYSGEEYSLKIPFTILEWVRKTGDDVILLPVGIYYERKPEKYESGKVSSLYSGIISRINSFFRKYKNTIISLGEPINVKKFLSNSCGIEIPLFANKLRENLLDELEREKVALRGPGIVERRTIIENILKEQSVNDLIVKLSKEKGESYESIKQEAYRILAKMVADYNERFISFGIRILGFILSRLFNKIYVDKKFISIIKESIKKGTTVLVPNHRSYLDSFLIAHTLYKNNLALPYIASGINLNFWPMGFLARKAGAYFIRRSAKGDRLYWELLSLYIKYLLKQGHMQKIFIEGTRSRSGKQLYPKTGLLSILYEAKKDNVCEDINFVPISITYESIMEYKSLTKEIAGETKKNKESFARFLKARNLFKRKYGSVFVNANNYVSLKEFEEEKHLNVVSELALHLSSQINRASTVSVSSVVSSVLLTKDKRAISLSDIKDRACFLVRLFRENKDLNISEDLHELERAVGGCLNSFRNIGVIDECFDGIDKFYSIKYNKRFALDYYKNTSIYFLVSYSLISNLILIGNKSVNDLFSEFIRLRALISYEFFLIEAVSLDEFREILDIMKRMELLKIEENDMVTIESKNKNYLKLLRRVTLNYLEAYWGILKSLKRDMSIIDSDDYVNRIYNELKILHFKGDIERREAISKPIIESAINRINQEPKKEEYIDSNLDLLQGII